MTQAQAQTTVSAAIGAGYSVRADSFPDLTWTVTLQSGSQKLDLQVIATFAAANGLSGTPNEVVLK